MNDWNVALGFRPPLLRSDTKQKWAGGKITASGASESAEGSLLHWPARETRHSPSEPGPRGPGDPGQDRSVSLCPSVGWMRGL